jgi:hypothetical protein
MSCLGYAKIWASFQFKGYAKICASFQFKILDGDTGEAPENKTDWHQKAPYNLITRIQ